MQLNNLDLKYNKLKGFNLNIEIIKKDKNLLKYVVFDVLYLYESI